MTLQKIFMSLFLFYIFVPASYGAGTLSKNIRIESSYLGYDLQFRIYVPADAKGKKLQTLYITDGQWYLDKGHFKSLLDRKISNDHIDPIIAIFIDSRNPDNFKEIRRNKEFFCNAKYVQFVTNELIPFIDKSYPTHQNRASRGILGLSFGGINSACFGLMAYPFFQNIAMQSPANSKHVSLLNDLYKKEEKRPLKIFMSVGTKNDNTATGRKFNRTLQRKGYDITYKEVQEGHNWRNWRPLLDDILITFFAPSP